MSTEPPENARERRGAARRAVLDADAASRRLRESHHRALALLGENGNTSNEEVLEDFRRRMLAIEHRMRETEQMMRDAETGLTRADPEAAGHPADDASGRADEVAEPDAPAPPTPPSGDGERD